MQTGTSSTVCNRPISQDCCEQHLKSVICARVPPDLLLGHIADSDIIKLIDGLDVIEDVIIKL